MNAKAPAVLEVGPAAGPQERQHDPYRVTGRGTAPILLSIAPQQHEADLAATYNHLRELPAVVTAIS
jgi:hypothetical protein